MPPAASYCRYAATTSNCQHRNVGSKRTAIEQHRELYQLAVPIWSIARHPSPPSSGARPAAEKKVGLHTAARAVERRVIHRRKRKTLAEQQTHDFIRQRLSMIEGHE